MFGRTQKVVYVVEKKGTPPENTKIVCLVGEERYPPTNAHTSNTLCGVVLEWKKNHTRMILL
jgi:hypothetical protein